MKKIGVKKEVRIQAKNMHVTIHKVDNDSHEYWLQLAKSFRSNVQAVLVGLEENHEEEKGLHAHIVIQFTTKQQLFRRQFVDHFGSNCINIQTKANKESLVMALGYVSKTGNTKQYGDFMYKGVPLDANPEVYRFNYQVKTKDDAIKYYQKVIEENLKKNKNVILELAKRKDAIGRYLVAHPTLMNSLHKLAMTWYLDVVNSEKKGFLFAPWVHSPSELRYQYQQYLKAFPEIFGKNLPRNSSLRLEEDYGGHIEHDCRVIKLIVDQLEEALQYGSKRPLKALNLYLWSINPSFGKTRLLNFLDKNLMNYRLPDDQWYVDYENNFYQVLVSDEARSFLKSKSYSHLKHIFEGQKVEFNLKGKTKVLKEDNPLIVLAENESFDSIMKSYFKGQYQPQVMATRVMDLEVRSRATLHFLIDRCTQTPETPLPLFEKAE